MFLFRKNVEPAEDHEPIDVTNTAQEEAEEEEVHDEEEAEEQQEVENVDDDGDDDHNAEDADAAQHEHEAEDDEEEEVHEQQQQHEAEEEAEPAEDVHGDSEEDGPHATREGTVPPLEQRNIVHQHQEEVEAEEAAQARASAPSHSAAAVPVPGLTMPRTYASAVTGVSPHSNSNNNNNNNNRVSTSPSSHPSNVMRRGSRATTPRAGGQSPRSHSNAGHSYAGSALSAEETAVVEQQYRHCASVVQAARSISERRASSVNQLLGSIDGGAAAAARRRSGSMTAAEREAVEQMMDNEFHRQEAAERSAQFTRIREATLLETELEKEKASYETLLQKERERHAEITRRTSLRDQRMAEAAQRRQSIEAQRQQAILASVSEKESRYTTRDPYAVVVAQRRYRSPIAPSRRQSTPASAQPGTPRDSRRGSGTVVRGSEEARSRTHSASPAYRRNSAPDGNARQCKPGIDMSPPKQCLPMNAWKTPEQLKQNVRAGTDTNRCLPPGAWEAATVADHPRQWH